MTHLPNQYRQRSLRDDPGTGATVPLGDVLDRVDDAGRRAGPAGVHPTDFKNTRRSSLEIPDAFCGERLGAEKQTWHITSIQSVRASTFTR